MGEIAGGDLPPAEGKDSQKWAKNGKKMDIFAIMNLPPAEGKDSDN